MVLVDQPESGPFAFWEHMAEKPARVIRWQFSYKKNPQPVTSGTVEATSERIAVMVAEKWCALNGARFIGGSVRSDVLADESILKISTEPEAFELPSAVEATTLVNG